MLIGVGVSCRIKIVFYCYVFIFCSGSLFRLGKKSYFSAIVKEFPLPLGAWDRLRYSIVALP